MAIRKITRLRNDFIAGVWGTDKGKGRNVARWKVDELKG
jgi:hypothetical protein